MTGHPDPARYSALLDGDVPAAETRDLREHLLNCVECSTLIEDLQAIRETAGTLPEFLPPRDLWPEIARELQGDAERDPQVIPLHGPESLARRQPKRSLRLSVPQAAAAGIVLALLSGAVGAGLGRSGGEEGVVQAVDASIPVTPSWVSNVREAQPGLEARALEVAALEESLLRSRGTLDPVTVGVLERSLAVIDEAIRESLAAIRVDPGNRFLKENLERAVLAKGEFLQDAALLVVPAT